MDPRVSKWFHLNAPGTEKSVAHSLPQDKATFIAQEVSFQTFAACFCCGVSMGQLFYSTLANISSHTKNAICEECGQGFVYTLK